MKKTTTSASDGKPVQFPPTLWTIVLEANQAETQRAELALGELCVYYREAIHSYFRLKCRHPQDAEDLSGAFFEHLLKRKRLGSFQREACPRFRAYLSVALRNFFADWIEQKRAEKRGSGQPDESLDVLREAGFETADEDRQLKQAVDLGIARTLHRQVMEALQNQAADRHRFDILRSFIPYEQGVETYEQAAKQLNITVPTLRKAVFDLRRNYVLQFRLAVAPTVRNVRTEVDSEAGELLDLLPEAISLESIDRKVADCEGVADNVETKVTSFRQIRSD